MEDMSIDFLLFVRLPFSFPAERGVFSRSYISFFFLSTAWCLRSAPTRQEEKVPCVMRL